MKRVCKGLWLLNEQYTITGTIEKETKKKKKEVPSIHFTSLFMSVFKHEIKTERKMILPIAFDSIISSLFHYLRVMMRPQGSPTWQY